MTVRCYGLSALHYINLAICQPALLEGYSCNSWDNENKSEFHMICESTLLFAKELRFLSMVVS